MAFSREIQIWLISYMGTYDGISGGNWTKSFTITKIIDGFLKKSIYIIKIDIVNYEMPIKFQTILGVLYMLLRTQPTS
jgi:hypothetical protein